MPGSKYFYGIVMSRSPTGQQRIGLADVVGKRRIEGQGDQGHINAR